MICYNVDYETVEELVKRQYTVLAFGKNDNLKKFEYKENFSIANLLCILYHIIQDLTVFVNHLIEY
jgi:hypothetical protein